MKVSQVAISRILVEVNHLWGEKPEDGQSPLCERSDRGEGDGEEKEDGAMTEGSQAGQNELSTAVLFDEPNVY